MGNTSSTNDKIKDFFNDSKSKDIGYKISDGLGKITNFAGTIMNNMMKLSSNLSDWMGSSIFPFILMGGGCIFIAYKLKMI